MKNVHFQETWTNATQELLNARQPGGFWVGELSSSALSTALALFTLSLYRRTATMSASHAAQTEALIIKGLAWLAEHQNADGGFGDTTRSLSNLSTSAIVWGAFNSPEASKKYHQNIQGIENWIRQKVGSLEARNLATAIADRYGKDRTFSVPILTMLSLAGRLGTDSWRWVKQLPFEWAALPFQFYQFLKLPVVSYALPALIAIGQVRHHHRPSWFLPGRWLRHLVRSRTLRRLQTLQPTTGGFLEATPLTAFVTMSLIASEQANSAVVHQGIRFLIESVRPDGSWPIDTNLTTWVTTLSINALGGVTDPAAVRSWLLAQQYQERHPYTQAEPGGWAWTDLPGGVPDADDTPSALLALAQLGFISHDLVKAAEMGCRWLLQLQNRDGGIPTFCRGWGSLPFDRSSCDLTAHTVRAWYAWKHQFDRPLQAQLVQASHAAFTFLRQRQHASGSWSPLWFGNQHASSDDVMNHIYGTSRVLKLCQVDAEFLGKPTDVKSCWEKGAAWLQQVQNDDGGWGGQQGIVSSVEETAWAVEALAWFPQAEESVARGISYLIQKTAYGTKFQAEPLGFYFAQLWYYEQLYPIIFTVAALRAVALAYPEPC